MMRLFSCPISPFRLPLRPSATSSSGSATGSRFHSSSSSPPMPDLSSSRFPIPPPVFRYSRDSGPSPIRSPGSLARCLMLTLRLRSSFFLARPYCSLVDLGAPALCSPAACRPAGSGSWSMRVSFTRRTPASVDNCLVPDGGRRVTGTAVAPAKETRVARLDASAGGVVHPFRGTLLPARPAGFRHALRVPRPGGDEETGSGASRSTTNTGS